jgi:hypothetical protein
MRIGRYVNQQVNPFVADGALVISEMALRNAGSFHLKEDTVQERDRLGNLARHLLAALHLAKPRNK